MREPGYALISGLTFGVRVRRDICHKRRGRRRGKSGWRPANVMGTNSAGSWRIIVRDVIIHIQIQTEHALPVHGCRQMARQQNSELVGELLSIPPPFLPN